MNTSDFISGMLNSKIECFKKVRIFNIEYFFKTEEVYKKFMEHKIYEWAYQLSERMIKKFNEEKFIVYVSDEYMRKGESIADGIFIYSRNEKGEKVNALIIDADDNPHVLFHEFGHFIDACMGEAVCQYSRDIAIKALILLEATNFAHAYAINYEQQGFLRDTAKENPILSIAQATYFLETPEYFAEAFALYMTDSKLLESLCPQTYKYIKQLYLSLF